MNCFEIHGATYHIDVIIFFIHKLHWKDLYPENGFF